MKTFFLFCIVLILLAGGGYIGYQYLAKFMPAPTGGATQTGIRTAPVVKKGVLRKVQNPKDDYTHLLQTSEGLVKLNSYTVQLDSYVGKTVQATGQYSGNTLFADSVTSIQ